MIHFIELLFIQWILNNKSCAKNIAEWVLSDCFQKCMYMAQGNMHRELLETQQQNITSFIESFEKEIGTNTELTHSLLEQASSAALRSLQEQGGF